MITPEKLKKWFTYRPASGGRRHACDEINEAARHLSMAILAHTDPSADQSAAIRKVREAVLTAQEALSD